MHFVVAIGYDDNGYIYANDPNKSEHPRKQHQDKFKTCLKQAFIFWPEAAENELPESDEIIEEAVEETIRFEACGTSGATGMNIVDISKWQGNIDFDKLACDVALVIARASCGSDKDVKFDSYAKAMTERRIPFGVYCYSYAGTVEKARDEAQKIIQYAGTYDPLFYVVDAEEARMTNATIRAFAEALRSNGVKRIGCYVAHNHYKDYGYDTLRDLFDFTWIPRYGTNNGTVSGSTKPAYLCDLWQYTSTGRVAGIPGNVDMNVITGDGKTLAWFLGSTEERSDVPVQTKQVQIVGGNVNIRTAPNTNGSIIGVAMEGSMLQYGGQTAENGWLSVVYNGINGWLSNKYGKLV